MYLISAPTLSLIILSGPVEAVADNEGLEVSGMFRDHAVIQLADLPVWGATPSGASVYVEFDGQRVRTTGDEHGN